ncbi:MAG: 30S ribosomal protein S4e [Candidatus Hydrothermarchaeales archaeon]
MGKRHLKRLAAPRTWKLRRKEHVWAVKPRPGPHPQERSLPLLLVVRDVLGYARNSREAKKIIHEGSIVVNGKVRKDFKFSVGLMDILQIPKTKEQSLVLFDKKGKIILTKIKKKESKSRLCRIVDKTVVDGGHIQLNLHDGTNYLVKVKDPKKPKEDIYKTKDTVLMNLKDNSLSGHIPFKEGNLALIIGGAHMGEVAKIEEIRVVRSPNPNIVVLSSNDKKFQTIDDYLFMIGENKPVISEVV